MRVKRAPAPEKTGELERGSLQFGTISWNGTSDRSRREPREARLIDEAFRQKFQAVSRGQTIDILSCSANWDQGH